MINYEQLKQYKEAINDFETRYINENFKNYLVYQKYNHSGYLINLEVYENLKNKIKEYSGGYVNLSTINHNEFKLKDIEFKTSSYLVNMLLNGNKYKIINSQLWKLFGQSEKKDPRILYHIDQNIISFNLEEHKSLKFICKSLDNVIDINSFSKENNSAYYSNLVSKYKDIDNIYQQILEYYKFEREIILYLNGQKIWQKHNDLCYLVNGQWFQMWMEKTNYKEIKQILSTSQDKIPIKKIKDRIIRKEEINRINNINLSKALIMNFDSIKQLQEYLKNNLLFLVSFDCMKKFEKESNESFLFNISKNNIKLSILGNEINIKSVNNIITYKQNNIYLEENTSNQIKIYWKLLLDIFFFNKEIKTRIISKYDNQINKKNEIYFINKNSMDKFKNFYDYSSLRKILELQNFEKMNYNNLKINYDSIVNYIKSFDKELFEKINRKISSNQYRLDEEYNKIPYKIANLANKQIKYFEDFEILDEEIVSYFEQLGLIQKKILNKGEYIEGEQKILFFLNESKNNYMQIHYYDFQNEKFVVEYALENLFHLSNDYFREIGIYNLLNCCKNNQIKYSNSHICNCYKIMNNESSTVEGLTTPFPTHTDSCIIDEYSRNIIYLLLYYLLFKLDIEKKISDSKIIVNTNTQDLQLIKYYLVNKNIITEFLNCFWDEKINEIIHKYKISSVSNFDENEFNNILNKEDLCQLLKRINDSKDNFIEKIKNIDFYKVDTVSIQNSGKLINYPKDLMFLDYTCYFKFLSLFNIKKEASKFKDSEIDLNYNFGNLAFKSDKLNFLGSKLYLIYIYSMEENKFSNKNINFNLDFILSFSSYLDFINYKNIFSGNIKYNCTFLKNEFERQNKLKIHLLKENQNQEIENNLNKNLLLLVELYKEYLSLKDKMNLSDNDTSNYFQTDENYYIINKKFIDDFEKMIYFKEIKIILDKNTNLYLNFDIHKEDCLEKIKKELHTNIKNKLSEFVNNSNFIKFNSDSYKVERSKLSNHNKFYYDNFIIINDHIKNILNTFFKSNSPISNLIEPVDIFSRDNKLFIKYEKYISVGYIDQNEQIIIDILIVPNYKDHLKCFYEVLKEKGYLFLQTFLSKGIIEIQYKKVPNYTSYYYLIKADIYNVFHSTSSNNIIQESEISEKLKKLILFYLELQNNNISELNNKLEEEVYLINSEIISNQCLIEIGSLIQSNKDVFDYLLKMNSTKEGIEQTKFEEIISTKYNKEKLKQLDEKCLNIKFNDLKPCEQKVILNDGKEVNIYRSFIMIKRDRCYTKYYEFGLYNLTRVFYTKAGNDDIIINEDKKFISIGKIGDNNYFNVKYILYIQYLTDFDSELKQIKENGIEKYLKIKTVFKNDIKEDTISPIFTKNTEAGICYRLEPGVNDYRKKTNYCDYINNKKFLKAYKLCEYYKILKQNINSVYPVKGNYYLINKKAMSIIKKFYYYNDIKAILDQIFPNEINQSNPSKILLYIVKSLSDDTFENLIENQSEMEKIENNLIEPEIEPVYAKNMDRNQESPLAWIHNNFEVIEDKIAKLLFNINSGYLFSFESNGYNLNDQFECVLKDGKIMIKNNKKNSGNTKEIVVIGSLNVDDSFINEYVLIYDQYYYSQVSELEKKDLNNYLRGIQFANDLSPIVINQINIIGQIVKLQNVKINIDNIDNQMDIEEKVPYEVTPKDNQFKNQNKTNIEKNKIKKKDMDNFPSLSDKEYNLDSIHNVTSIKQYFAYPPLIGLDNIGATCYMNATLQCLCNIEKFVDYFKYNAYLINVVRNDKEKTKLCSSFKLLIEKLWPDKIDDNRVYNKQGFFPSFNIFEAEGSFNSRTTNKSYPPEDFKTKISKMNSLFEGVAANDAKDLVQFLIMTLHEELNKVKVQNINNAVNNDQRNKQLMFQIFAQDFITSNKSVISDLFYGVNYNITQCGYCGTRSFNYQTYFFLVFPLEEVRIFKSQNNLNYNFNNNYFNSNEVNIYDCFFYDQRINYMTGSNIMYCNFCRQTCNSSMRTFLSTGPEILIIILNRGKGIQFKVKINFSLEIDLSNFIEMKQTGCRYNLIGVITHLGESGMGGHFIAYCKNPISGDWHKYNDSIVSKVENFKTEVIDFAMPYLLFYQKSA